MTIETEIAALTTATTTLLGAVNVAKSTLDAKVSDASASALAARQGRESSPGGIAFGYSVIARALSLGSGGRGHSRPAWCGAASGPSSWPGESRRRQATRARHG